MSAVIPPVQVSRMVLLVLVAVGAVVSISSTGTLSAFSGGFAAGAGCAFVFAWLKRREPAGEPGGNGEGP